MNKRKILVLAMSLCVVAILMAGATLAYFTDTDGAVNVMVAGNVKITHNEHQRKTDPVTGEYIAELEEFKQQKVLLPVTYPGNRTADKVEISGTEFTLNDAEANYVDKIITVTNDGNTPAYVRTLFAVPTGGSEWEPTPVNANNCWLHWNYLSSTDWVFNTTVYPLVEVNGKGYYVWEFVHTSPVAAGVTTKPNVRGFYLDKKVSIGEDGYYYMNYEDSTSVKVSEAKAGDTVTVYSMTQAVQAEGFNSAEDALNEAFGELNAENAEKWFAQLFSAGAPEDDTTGA